LFERGQAEIRNILAGFIGYSELRAEKVGLLVIRPASSPQIAETMDAAMDVTVLASVFSASVNGKR
jgi:hypothetical protein